MIQIGLDATALLGNPGLPHKFSSLLAWWDVSDAATVTKNGSDLVSQLNDKSGNGFHFTQSTEADRPLWVASGINSKPSLSYDGETNSGKFMSVAIDYTGITQLTVVAVFQNGDVADDTGHYVVIANAGINSNSGFAISFFPGPTGGSGTFNYHAEGAGGDNGITSVALIDGEYIVNSFRIVEGTSMDSWFNGTQDTTTDCDSNDTIENSSTVTYLGNDSSEAYAFEGYIAEVMLFSTVLSDVDENAVRQYCANKWGVSLA